MKTYIIALLSCLILISCGADMMKKTSSTSGANAIKSGTYTGLDINGLTKSCSGLPANVACTMEYGPGDQYANNCRNNNKTAIACSCHDYICVNK